MSENSNLQLSYWHRSGYKLRQTSSGTIALTIHPLLQRHVASILQRHQIWLKRALQPRTPLPGNRADYQKKKAHALEIIGERLREINQHYGYSYHRVSVRHMTSRWGSCSRAKNLSFNYRLLYVAPKLRDYVITHELCHIREMNHSPRFWKLVAETIPDYKKTRSALRLYSLANNIDIISPY